MSSTKSAPSGQQKTEQIINRLGMLGMAKNQSVAPAVLATYANILAAYPLEVVEGAILALCGDSSAFFPPVGRIIEEMAQSLRGRANDSGQPPILGPDDAWKLARLVIRAYQPQTRPVQRSGNPAVDEALRLLGGLGACQWSDDIGQGIVRRRFLDEYERQCVTPDHIRWALVHGPREPLVLRGIEIPQHEVEAIVRQAEMYGRSIPADRHGLLSNPSPRAAVLDGQPLPLPPLDLLALPEPFAPEVIEANRVEIERQLQSAAERMAWPGEKRPARRGTTQEDIERGLAEAGLVWVAAPDGEPAVAPATTE